MCPTDGKFDVSAENSVIIRRKLLKSNGCQSQEVLNIGISGDILALLRILPGCVIGFFETLFETVEFSLKPVEFGILGLQLLLRG